MTERMVERRIVTVLFADLVGFTSLSERLDAEDVALVQDAYFDAVRETIERHGGLLEKFVGDAAMAVFGAPRVRDDDAERAVRAGLALVAAVGAPRRASSGSRRTRSELRVGVNSGEVVYGEATAERGPVTGDTVNVAARLQAAAEPGPRGRRRADLARGRRVGRAERTAGSLELKGKAEPVPAWQVVGVHAERSRERALGGLRVADDRSRRGARSACSSALGGRCQADRRRRSARRRQDAAADEYAALAARRGAVVLRARLRPDLLSPFEPVGQLVRSVAERRDVARRLMAAGHRQARAAVVAEALARRRRAGRAPERAVADERASCSQPGSRGSTPSRATRRCVWLVEDLHWASPTCSPFSTSPDALRSEPRTARRGERPGRSLLESAAEWCDGRRAPPPRAAAAGGDGGARARRSSATCSRRSSSTAIAERSGGNALFVEELLRTWVEHGRARARTTAAAGSSAADAQDVALPPTVQAIYAGQLDDLPAAGARGCPPRRGRRPPLPVRRARPARGRGARRGASRRSSGARSVSEPRDDPILGPSHVLPPRAAARRRLREPRARRALEPPRALRRLARGVPGCRRCRRSRR